MSVPDVSGRSLVDLLSLAGRAAVVTGGGRGIGAAIVSRLAEAGADVVVGDIDEAAARQCAAEVAQRTERTVVGTAVDVADEASVRALADTAVERLGRLDVWINNAGVLAAGSDLWDHALAVNLTGTFLGTREAATRMVAAGRPGVVVNMASTASFRGNPSLPAYSASKHGVQGLTKSLAGEFGPHGVRVLAVAPGIVRTPGLDELAARDAAGTFDDRLRTAAERLPLRRAGVPDDVARVVVFCASDLAMLMTGTTVVVDAGDLAY